MSKTTTIVREGESCEVTCINPGKVRSFVRSIPGSSSVDRISGIFQIMGDPSRLGPAPRLKPGAESSGGPWSQSVHPSRRSSEANGHSWCGICWRAEDSSSVRTTNEV